MKDTPITGNGDFNITLNGIKTLNGESTVYAPLDIGGASMLLGWTDNDGSFNEYTDDANAPAGALVAGQAKRTRHGTGTALTVQVSGFTAAFSIGIAPQ